MAQVLPFLEQRTLQNRRVGESLPPLQKTLLAFFFVLGINFLQLLRENPVRHYRNRFRGKQHFLHGTVRQVAASKLQ